MEYDNIQKIRSLMAKTIENGATESEALQAMVLAKKLMSKYGISMNDVKNKTINADDFIWGSNKTNFETYASDFEVVLSIAISAYTNTKTIKYTSNFGKATNDKKRIKRNSIIMFFGHKIDVELAVYMLNVCNSALQREWALYRASVEQKIHGNRIKNFSIGMASRIYERIKNLMEEEIKISGNELIVVKNAIVNSLFEPAKEEIGINNTKKLGLVKYNDDDSYQKGYESGDKVELHKSFNNKNNLKIGKE